MTRPAEPAAADPGAGTAEEPEGAVPEGVVGGVGEGGESGTGGGPSGPPPAPPPPPAPQPPRLDDASRRDLTERYLREIIRSRIGRQFRYPPEAEPLELVGQVIVRVSIDARGGLVRAHISGTCPHPVLCDDALRTVRAAAPFPPPPAILGAVLQVDVPLDYRLE